MLIKSKKSKFALSSAIIMITAMALLLITTTMTKAAATPTTTGTDRPDLKLGSIKGAVTTADVIEAAETNTDIDLQKLDDLADQAIAQVIALKSATESGSDADFSIAQAQLGDTLQDIEMEIVYVTPEQVQLVNPVEPDDDNDNQTAIVDNRDLNVTFIDESASDVSSIRGTLFALNLFNEGLTENNIEAIMGNMTQHLLEIQQEVIFSVPLEQVQIVGGMTPSIDELRKTEAELNPPSTLVLP